MVYPVILLTSHRKIIQPLCFLKPFLYFVYRESYTFQDIYRETDFYSFLTNRLATTVFYDDPSNAANETGAIITSNSVIGGVRLREMRVDSRNCTDIPTAYQTLLPCYYMTYSDSIRETDPFNVTNATTTLTEDWINDWTAWSDADTLGALAGVEGELASYDGSGYTVDIPWGTSQADVQAFVTYLTQNGYISLNTRAIVISFTLYNEVGEFFIYNELVVEVLPTGILLPSKVNLIPFRTSFRTSATDRPSHLAYDTFRTIFAVLLMLFLLYRVVKLYL